MLERTASDDTRTFEQWRDQTAAHFEELARRCENRAAIVPNLRHLHRRGATLKKLAALLRHERE